MLRTIERYCNFTIERIWFATEMKKLESRASILRFMRVETMPDMQNQSCLGVDTLWSNLRVDESELMKPMRKQVRYEIRRALKENIVTEVYNSAQIKAGNLLLEFEETFNHFCELSHQEYVKKSYKRKMLQACIEKNGLFMTVARFEKGKVYHIYETDGRIVLLNFSASDFRNEDVDNNLAARANKLLHYKDMLFFKEMGCEVYDWGNISSISEPNGIDNFKISFGGENKKIYYSTVANSFMGKVLIDLKEKIGK